MDVTIGVLEIRSPNSDMYWRMIISRGQYQQIVSSIYGYCVKHGQNDLSLNVDISTSFQYRNLSI